VTLYLFWDIDGTLLLTARAGVFALEEASEEVLGTRVDLSTMRTAGMTDFEIAQVICAALGVDDPSAPAAFLAVYERLLPERLGWRKGRVLPNVRENLEALSDRDDVVNMLLTGNVAGGAEAKLRHYGLWEFFGAGGAFSTEGCDRPSIARRARELAAEHGGEVPPGERMVVIGDTPHDIRCGQAIGARTVAVATGPGYGLDALEACDPWAAIEQLPAPPELERLLGLDGR
jgi:phosphoglycolate phosphatase-like HAD superfamily hydrolase